ncbi:hypothetical protein BAUCODRAFT_144066 [Baudoinia panamericana UAMH 10762]|uniref:CsbD-like domain-containing protein n=1 Tax=Baudoinia panamericana (strain UAMH 10762) TaxID=717646 RepID=M2M071_BAUPA|nr:uncharacterized protein BAUCODRAFT_144066 [Baudoinia panamericana UAMH 10762]EMD00388.1 hypothetical protein BAUCODRAFT_144066 [Baudoinia panamericana UAMH 10762]
MSSSEQNPTLIGGHAQYVKGAAEVSVVGSVTGAESWQKSAESDKQAGIDAMKQASANRDPQKDGYGKVEEMAGKVTGCEGMEKEGAQSTRQ